MGLYQKISILGPSAQYDTCGPRDFGNTTDIPGVYHAKVGGNNICRLFKVLQTNACKNNCNYCAYRRDRDTPRAFAAPAEMAKAFDSAYSRRLVDGLFLSSGIVNNPTVTMSRMLDTVNILRSTYHYRGYVHLKIMPGTPSDCIRESLKVANRLSLNIESPTEADLHALSPDKDLKSGFFDTLRRVKTEMYKNKLCGKKSPSLTTQFVVGAGKEMDSDIIRSTYLLYKRFGLTRVFYSVFRPVSGTPLEDRRATSLVRQHRLYQADFLMRFYKFLPAEIPLDSSGYLSEAMDPKLLWAQQHPEFFPININKASFFDLVRVPGIGPTSAKKIINLRNTAKIYSFSQLAGMRLYTKKMGSYINF